MDYAKQFGTEEIVRDLLKRCLNTGGVMDHHHEVEPPEDGDVDVGNTTSSALHKESPGAAASSSPAASFPEGGGTGVEQSSSFVPLSSNPAAGQHLKFWHIRNFYDAYSLPKKAKKEPICKDDSVKLTCQLDAAEREEANFERWRRINNQTALMTHVKCYGHGAIPPESAFKDPNMLQFDAAFYDCDDPSLRLRSINQTAENPHRLEVLCKPPTDGGMGCLRNREFEPKPPQWTSGLSEDLQFIIDKNLSEGRQQRQDMHRQRVVKADMKKKLLQKELAKVDELNLRKEVQRIHDEHGWTGPPQDWRPHFRLIKKRLPEPEEQRLHRQLQKNQAKAMQRDTILKNEWRVWQIRTAEAETRIRKWEKQWGSLSQEVLGTAPSESVKTACQKLYEELTTTSSSSTAQVGGADADTTNGVAVPPAPDHTTAAANPPTNYRALLPAVLRDFPRRPLPYDVKEPPRSMSSNPEKEEGCSSASEVGSVYGPEQIVEVLSWSHGIGLIII